MHGSTKKINLPSAGEADQNVFDITQGVAVLHGSRHLAHKQHCFRTAALLGTRQSKYGRLASLSLNGVPWAAPVPDPPFFQFVETERDGAVEYGDFYSMKDAFPLQSVGIQTSRDHLAIDFTRQELIAKISDFVAPTTSDAEVRKRYFPRKKVGDLPAGDTRGWDLSKARKELARVKDLGCEIVAVHYRPFDWRYVFDSTLLVDWPRPEVSEQMRSGKNLGLCLVRRTEHTRDYDYFSVSRQPISNHQVSLKDGTYLLPLYVENDRRGLFAENRGRCPNLSPSFLKALAAVLKGETKAPQGLPTGVTPEDVFSYIYAVFQSPAYRKKYSGFLKIDFPRLPLTGTLELFRDLAHLGGELTALHLMESSKLDSFITTYTGPKSPEVGRVGWSHDTVWLDAAATKKGQPAKPGTIGFHGVPESVWNFHIGGYQVCEKWLKDRKGRTLSKDDIAHYQKIVVALSETIRIMAEIDVVIEQHGGWPGAFQTGEAKAESAKIIPFRPRTVDPKPEERYVTCVPLVPLKAAAGAFSDPQNIDDDGFEWAAVETRRRLRSGMFVAQVVGRSMEPAIPDGSWCLFAAPVEGTRQGKTVLVELRDATDPESGERYTVKRYESEKAAKGDSWRHDRITLKPVNPEFEPIVLTAADEGEFTVVAELVEVLGPVTSAAET